MISQKLSSSAPDAACSAAATRVMVIGNRDQTNIGASLERSARSLGLPVEVLESKNAMHGPSWLRVVKWHFMGHTPAQLDRFSDAVLTRCAELKPTFLLTTGLAPVNEATLRRIGTMGICRC